MRCNPCQQPIRPGAEERKRVEWHVVFNEARGNEVRVFGENMPDGPLSQATGRLLKVAHSKCYWAEWKRVNRGGDAKQGTRPGLVDIYEDDDD